MKLYGMSLFIMESKTAKLQKNQKNQKKKKNVIQYLARNTSLCPVNCCETV